MNRCAVWTSRCQHQPRRQALWALGLSALAALPVHAQSSPAAWPVANKPITIVSAYPAGGSSDVLGRAIGEKLAEKLKVPVLVENKAGGGGQIAAAYIKQQAADGHTLWLGDVGPFATNAHVYAKLSYDIRKDFMPVAKLVDVPVFLVVPTGSPHKTLADLIKASKAGGSGLNYGSQGAGLGGHIYGELFKREVQGQFNHIPYKGSIPGLTDLVGGQIDLMHDNVLTSGPFVKGGKLRALAVRANQRLTQFPEVPTMTELGLGKINHVLWFGVVVKAGTPAPVVQQIAQEVMAATRHPDVTKKFSELGMDIATLGPQDFQKFLALEYDKWGAIIRDTHIRLED